VVNGALGVATATSLAIGGATLGSNELAVAGTSLFTNTVTITGAVGVPALTVTGPSSVSTTIADFTAAGSGAPRYVNFRNTSTGQMSLLITGNNLSDSISLLTGTTCFFGSNNTLHIASSTAGIVSIGTGAGTNPTFYVDSTAASVATGLKVTGAAAAGGVAVAAISSGTNENLTIDAKGSGTITLGGTSTGAITLTRATTLSAALTYGGVTLSNSVVGTGSMLLGTTGQLTVGMACGTSGTITLNGTFNKINWTRVGNRLLVSGLLLVDSVSSPVGALTVTGMTAATTYSTFAISFQGGAGATNYTLFNRISPSGTTIEIGKMVANALSNLAGDIQAGSELYISGEYTV